MRYTGSSNQQQNKRALAEKTKTLTRDRQSVQLQGTKWLFLSLCFYLLSQCYTIPILSIGPWALWPTFSDVAACLLVFTFLINLRHISPASTANKKTFLILLTFVVLNIFSYLNYVAWQANMNSKGVGIGLVQLGRFIEFIMVFWITSHIPLPAKRIQIITGIIDFVFVFVCLGIFATFLSIIPLDILVAHLPQDGNPWGDAYRAFENLTTNTSGEGYASRGLGTIGSNHAYTGVQVILLLGLKMHLKVSKFDGIFILMSLLACLASGSRSSLAGMLFLTVIYWIKKPIYIFITGISVFLTTALSTVISNIYRINNIGNNDFQFILERQSTIFAANKSENLSERDQIWADVFKFIDRQPLQWLWGAGFGSAPDATPFLAAHNLYLQIILDTGVIGLLIFLFLFFQIVYELNKYENVNKSLFWVTLILLFTSLSQETFYPMIAMGHFLGFYLCSIAIAFRNKDILELTKS